MAAKSPNILMIAVDDLRDIPECFQAFPAAITPNMDRLAKRGILFSNAHCPAPACAPSRNSLLTGIQPSTSGSYGFQPLREVPVLCDAVTLPKHFRENGYHVMGTGKIHHSAKGHGPHRSEWDEYWPSIENAVNTFNGTAPEKDPATRDIVWAYGDTPEEECGDYQHASWAAEKVSEQYDKPFFMALGFIKPHLPLVCPKKYFDLYDPATLPPVMVKENDLDDIPEAGRRLAQRSLYRFMKEQGLATPILHAYLACVSYIDAQLGRVLDALESGPNARDTIILFWGDNGWHLGEKHHWTKFTLWKESTRVPLMMAGPGIAERRICTKPVGLIDLYPTLLTQCGLPLPVQTLEGRDISPLLSDPDREWDFPVVTTYGRDNHCLTGELWKYIRYFDGSEELYNRLYDPYEWTNLAENPNYGHIKESFKKRLPQNSHPNVPGTTLKHIFASDYPDMNWWRERFPGE